MLNWCSNAFSCENVLNKICLSLANSPVLSLHWDIFSMCMGLKLFWDPKL